MSRCAALGPRSWAAICTLLSDTGALFLQLGPATSDTLLDGLDLEHQLRGFLLKLQFADAWMKPLPQGLPAGFLLSAQLVVYPGPCHTCSVYSHCETQPQVAEWRRLLSCEC